MAKVRSGAEKNTEKRDREVMFKTLNGSLENSVVVKSATGEEGNELTDFANSQEDGNATVETNSSTRSVLALSGQV
jgi:hypothetical protein